MSLPPPPEGWESDGLAKFLDAGRQNAYWHFVHNRPAFARLSAINEAFTLVAENLTNPPDWFVALFFQRAHASFLAAAQSALASQPPEAFMLMRGCLENAIYAFHFHRDPESHQRWLNRHASSAALKVVKNEFKITQMMKNLTALHPELGDVVTALYERSIDRGAHPNERGLTQVSQFTEGTETYQITVSRISAGDTKATGVAMRSTAQTGVAVLKVFHEFMPERFDLLGASQRIAGLQQGL